MYVGGALVRSESGRSPRGLGRGRRRRRRDPAGVDIPAGLRKDVRDAVLVAKGALPEKWEASTPFNRGQILYRLAEVLESRAPELEGSLMRAGATAREAAREVAATVDRAVFYAGFADKVSALVASHNPVSGPHFGFSLPEAMGVVGVLAPRTPALLGLVSVILPVITGGNSCVVVASDVDPRTAVVLTECLATSDLPGGVVNVLTGYAKRAWPHPREAPRGGRARRVELRRRAPRLAGARRGEQRQAREDPRAARRGVLVRHPPRAGARLHRAHPRDQDRLAPGRGLSGATRPVVHDESGHASSTNRAIAATPRLTAYSSGRNVAVSRRNVNVNPG